MAAAISQVFRDHTSTNAGNPEVSRQEIQAAIAKAVELRALHAALMHGNTNTSSPSSNFRFPAPSATAVAASLSSPVPHHASHFSAQDYPVFTPSYEDDPVHGYHQTVSRSRALSESWDDYGLLGLENYDETILSEYRRDNLSSRKGLPSNFVSLESHICPAEDQKSVTGSCANNVSVLQTSPGAEFYKSSRRNSMADFKSVSSCNQCKPAIITSESESATRNSKNSNVVAPVTNSQSSVQSSQTKSRGVFLSRLFPRLKKKHKNEASPNRTESEEVSQIFKDLGIMSVEALKKELIEANEHRDAALVEVAEMKSSLGELRQKLEYLETYCEGLKRALRQATPAKDMQNPEKPVMFPSKGKPFNSNGENAMPVTEEVMTEGFLQIVSEARLSIKQFCKTLIGQIEEADSSLMDNLNSLLQPYKLSLNSRYSKAVLYHLEAIINQTLYQDFENCVFQKNGSPKILDPQQDRQAQFTSFVALRNLSWNEVLRKGTKYYSEEFSKFCDQKMSGIIATLNWTRPWPEQLLQAFFVAAKCIWLLHLLAFSFSPPLGILRVEENRTFDSHYMEDMLVDRQRSNGPSKVKVMVMPGFYVQGRVLRCKVLCRYKSVT
ncbi:hypothetical protein CDL15_Pgr025406 [Punica granatum]|uniref:IRK-interacting protein n=1 Tax=Punica granatum TaxID=22663 RepID=A0A218W9P4_PUNGR|nr:hypothetical protein CDL15_Pgr025406 [Punica granatum]PKI61100.1 hypothetical protein CRG98_018545 [Punica granatum]